MIKRIAHRGIELALILHFKARIDVIQRLIVLLGTNIAESLREATICPGNSR